MKLRIVRALQKYLFNPPIKLLFAIGLAPPGYALLETIGRKTGKPRRIPVGAGRVGGQFWIVAEHGTKAAYVLNITHSARVRLKLRDGLRIRWYTGTAHLLPDDDPAAASVGLPIICQAAPAMRPLYDFLELSCSRFGLILIPELFKVPSPRLGAHIRLRIPASRVSSFPAWKAPALAARCMPSRPDQ